MIKIFKKTARTAVLLTVFCICLPFPALAELRSSNYVIFENVNHSFNGPVISNVSHSVSGASATVTWNTDVNASSFVEYDTSSGFSASMEQGNSAKTSTNHSVTLSGLSANTTYYYRVKSERANGGMTTGGTTRSFTTGSADGDEEEAPPAGGGGVLIIDKTDKAFPLISNVEISQDSYNSFIITWETDEEATSFIEYGLTDGYGSVYGYWEMTETHRVVLENLEEESLYHFRALSSDDWGNVGYSDDFTFTTGAGEGDEEEAEEVEETEDEVDLDAEGNIRALDFLRRLFPEVSLNNITPDILPSIGNLDELEDFVDAPVLSGEPGVNFSAEEATITWSTDIEANSLVAFAPEDSYNPGAAEPYLQIVGNPEEYTTGHEVTLYNLSPDTNYHFQIRSKARLGSTSFSRDYEFRTNIEELTITSFFYQVTDDQTAVFKWVTNKNADSSVKFTPIHNNVLAVDQSKTIKDNELSVIHEVEISEFSGGMIYEIELSSADAEGNTAAETLNNFSTSEDDNPPEISHIKADSTVFLDRSDKIQTIISWLTNEPGTSQVYYQEGVHGSDVSLSEKTVLNTNYTKEHVIVITKFKPGIVYSFKVESIDSGGNITGSKTHTFMTAKKRESIIQVIIRIFEDTFSWVKKIM